MDQVLGLGQLKTGLRVKVKGNPGTNGEFKALEVNAKPGEDFSVMEGKIQSIDPASRTIRMMNRDFQLGSEVEIKDIHRQPIQFADLKTGDLIKLKGTYTEADGFIPQKAKLQQFKGFDIEELQGFIDKVDVQNNAIEVMGFQIVVSQNTEIDAY